LQKRKVYLCKLGPQFIEYIHDTLVEILWPGGDPVGVNEYRDFGLIDSATARPFQSAFGQDAYPTILEKAAALFHSLNANHAFYNGNKRTAVLAFDVFLVANGYYSLISNSEMYDLAERTASYKQRGASNEQSYREILDTIRLRVATLGDLRKEAHMAQEELEQLYEDVVKARRNVRRLRTNTLIEVQ